MTTELIVKTIFLRHRYFYRIKVIIIGNIIFYEGRKKLNLQT